MSDPSDAPSGGGSVGAPQPGAAQLTLFAAPATGDEFNTLGERLVPKGCFKVEDVLFDFGSSFARPDIESHLPKLVQLRNDNKVQDPKTSADIFPPLSVFGHADPVDTDDVNKALSGRRATAVYAMLVRDVDLWEQLFTKPVGHDDWGTRAVQTMLSRVQEPIPIDGKIGDETRGAIRTFQTAQGLGVDGIAGPNTRKALYRAYMDALCGADLLLDKTNDFLARNQDGAGGKGDRQGCSEFNALLRSSHDEDAAFQAAADKTQRNQENAPNRRVMILLFAPGRRVNPAVWPCPRVSEGVKDCKKRFFPDAGVRRSVQAERRAFEDTKDTFACRFYQIMSDDSPCERVKPVRFPVAQIALLLRSNSGAVPLAKRKYSIQVTDLRKLEGTTDDDGLVFHPDVPSGDYPLRIEGFNRETLVPTTPATVPPRPTRVPGFLLGEFEGDDPSGFNGAVFNEDDGDNIVGLAHGVGGSDDPDQPA